MEGFGSCFVPHVRGEKTLLFTCFFQLKKDATDETETRVEVTIDQNVDRYVMLSLFCLKLSSMYDYNWDLITIFS